MKTYKKKLILFFTGLLFPVTLICTLLFSNVSNDKYIEHGNADSLYSITLNSSNAYSLTHSTSKERTLKTLTGADLVFEYSNVSAASGYHTKLNTNGYIKNVSTITSITSISSTFNVEGALQARLSYDNENWGDYFDLYSGNELLTDSNPYFVQFKALETVSISSITIAYSCNPNPDAENSTATVFGDFYCDSVGNTSGSSTTPTASNINNGYSSGSYSMSGFGGESVVSSISNGTQVYPFRDGGITLGSAKNPGKMTFNLNSEFAATKVEVYMNINTTTSGTTTTVSSTTSGTFTKGSLGSKNSDPTSSTWSGTPFVFSSETAFDDFTVQTSKRTVLVGVKITYGGTGSSIPNEEVGFSAVENNTSYNVGDNYSNDNNLEVKAIYSNASPVTLQEDETNGYTYAITDSNSLPFNKNNNFVNEGTYFVTVSYKSYPDVVIQISVTEAPVAPTITGIEAIDMVEVYDIGDVFATSCEVFGYIYLSDGSEIECNSYAELVSEGVVFTLTNTDTLLTLDPSDEFEQSGTYEVETYLSSNTSITGESFNITVNEAAPLPEQQWTRISGLSEITDGKYVISTATTSGGFEYLPTGSISTGNSTQVGFSSIDEVDPSQAWTFTSTGADNSYNIYNVDGSTTNYLACAAKNDGIGTSTSSAVWTASTGKVEIFLKHSNGRYLTNFLNGSDWRSYNSANVNPTSEIVLFKLNEGPVADVAVTSIYINESDTTMNRNDSINLSVSFVPSNATNQNLTWESNNSSVATVSSGRVTSWALGNATITATSEDGNFSDSVNIEVVDNPGYYKPNDLKYTMKELSSDYAPTEGTQKVLVIPINLQGNTAWKASDVSDMNTYYFGNKADTPSRWNSLKSYFETASEGAMDISGEVAPIYESSYSSSDVNGDSTGKVKLWDMISKAVANTKQYVDMDGYDEDNNGYIDSVHLITNDTSSGWSDPLWPHMWSTNASANYSSPNAKVYSITSLKHTDDARTSIHEQSHIYGIDDYYNYDERSTYTNIDFVGGADMQSQNMFDWNTYSKMGAGWVTPYVVDGTLDSTTITINPAATSGESILVGNDWNGTAFDEYILMELFAPVGNNEDDWSDWYATLGTGGIRLYHVDARVMGSYSYGGSGSIVDDISTSSYSNFMLVNTNSTEEGYNVTPYTAYRDYQLLHLLQAGGTNTFGLVSSTSSNRKLDRYDLFSTGDEFSLAEYGYEFFPNSTTMNDTSSTESKQFPYVIEFDHVSATSATITIRKI